MPKILKIFLVIFVVILFLAIATQLIIRVTYKDKGKNVNAVNQNENVNAAVNQTTNQNQNVNLNVNLNNNLNQNTNQGTVSDAKQEEEELKRLASLFAERFGSYSNQANYENILNLKVYMSKSMQVWADQFIRTSLASQGDTSLYYGITTKALLAQTQSLAPEKGKAEILVSTQRREATGSTSNATIFYQDIVIKFVKEAGAWKVNEAIWQEKK